jgi:hypothetical protein
MKNLLLVFALAALSTGAVAQQFTIDPATTNETFVAESMEQVDDGSGDVIVIGFAGDYAHMSRQTSAGTTIWSKTCVVNSGFHASAKRPDGNFVAVGFQLSSGLATLFSPDGNILWAKTFSSTIDTVVTFRSVAVDASGFSYVVGDKSPQRREILVKLDTDGSAVCTKQLQPTGSSCFAKKALILNGNLFVFGDGRAFAKAISAAKYTLAGSLLGYTVFGGFGPTDNFLDATYYQGQFIFSFWNSNDNESLMLAMMREDLTLDGNAVLFHNGIFGNDIGPLTLGMLSANQDGSLYVSGGMSSNGSNSSVIMKIGDDLASPLWGRKLLLGGLPTRTFQRELSNGKVMLVKTKDGTMLGSSTGVTVTTLSGVGDPIGINYCQLPQEFTFELWDAGWMMTTVQTRIPMSLVLTPANTAFTPYSPRANTCLGLLPITLLSFTGEKVDERVQLRWQTASEQNNEYFEVQRSLDREHWETIGVVAGAGNTSTANSYRLEDSEPFDGTNYYRLVQVDHDGTTTQSETVAVSFVREDAFVAYPNPVEPGTSFGIQGGEFETVRAFDLSGREVGLSSDGDKRFTLNAPSGVYLLSISRANGLLETLRVSIN